MTAITSGKPDMKLFWACFIALVATSFVFGVRANTIGLLQDGFNLSENEKGAINGAGMWPFAISIIFFSHFGAGCPQKFVISSIASRRS